MKRKWLCGILVGFSVLFSGCSIEDVPVDYLLGMLEEEISVDGYENSSTGTYESTEYVQGEIFIPEGSEVSSEYHYVSDLYGIPWYYGEAWVEVNDNMPLFDATEYLEYGAFEWYADLDELGRCGEAFANVCTETMPTEERGDISSIKPSGWQTAKYDCVSGKYLYNRCHLIGLQLAGENANPLNLITGTRYLNIDGMLEFENMVASYVKDTDNHVLYRVTPIFTGENLIADGVLMEAYSIEDSGEGVEFCVFAYNVQPGIEIDYATGSSYEVE